jgi:hypothetical protein
LAVRTDSTPDTPLLRRPATLASIAISFALLAVLIPVVLTPSPTTIFSIGASTNVVEVRPLCADKIVWDLPSGEAQGRSCMPLNPADLTNPAAFKLACTVGPAPVTVTMGAGSSAKIERDATDEWFVTFGSVDAGGCSNREQVPLHVSVGDEDLPADSEGYFYRPDPKAAGLSSESAPTSSARLALALNGRVIIGQAMQFGAGWSASPSPILHEASLVARNRAFITGEPLTVMNEQIEAGSIIDTHGTEEAGAMISGAPGVADHLFTASGFVQFFDDRLTVQVYQRRSISLLPHASQGRVIKVLRWRPLWASPLVQLGVSLIVLIAAVAGLMFSYYEARGSMPPLIRRAASTAPPRREGKQDENHEPE